VESSFLVGKRLVSCASCSLHLARLFEMENHNAAPVMGAPARRFYFDPDQVRAVPIRALQEVHSSRRL
jgi:hypothetical protein